MDHYNTARLKNAFLVKAVGLNNESWIKQQVSKRNSSSYQISVPSEQTLPSGKTLLSCSTSALPGTELSCFSSVLSENVNSFSSFFFFPPLIHFALVVPLGGLRATQGKQQEKSILRKKTKKLHFTLQWGNKKCFCCSQGFETEQTPAGGIGHKLYFYRKLGMVLGDTQTKTPPERIWKDGAALPSPHLYLHSAAFLGGFIRGWNN